MVGAWFIGPELVDGRIGEGSRNVRELIDPELPMRRRGALALADRPLAER